MENLIEVQIVEAVRGLLVGRVNEILNNWQNLIPLFEFSHFHGMTAVVPTIALNSCERSEKERIIQIDAYSLTVSLSVPETPESELYCYGYSAAVDKAIKENPTLGGVVDRAVINGKKFIPPKRANCGQDWELIISLRITAEVTDYVS